MTTLTARALLRLLPLIAALSLGLLSVPRDAAADCLQVGTTVICAGSSPGGFTAGAGVHGLAVDILPNATVGTGITLNNGNTVGNEGRIVVGDNATALGVGTANVVANLGRIAGGDGAVGIEAGSDSIIGNFGTIALGDSGTGILSNGDNLLIANHGTISFRNCGLGVDATGNGNRILNTGTITDNGCGGSGILAGDNGTIVNTGTISLGETGTAIFAGSGTTIVNTGTIVVGIEGNGIAGSGNMLNAGTIIVGDTIVPGMSAAMIGLADNQTVVNLGTLLGGQNQVGLLLNGNGVTAFNGGTITVGTQGFGIALQGNNGSASNAGTINAGANGGGLVSLGTGNTLRNTGTINVGSCGIGIDGSLGSATTVTNAGRIVGAGCALGVGLAGGDTFTNSGTVAASVSVAVGAGSGTAVTNSGTLDGRISLAGAGGHTLSNAGLITISTPMAPGGGVTHQVSGSFAQSAAGTLTLRVGPSGTAGNYDRLNVTGTSALNGKLRASVQTGLYGPVTTYVGALTSAATSGSFASVEASTMFFNTFALYTGGGVDLVLSRIPFNAIPNGGSNGRAVGNALEAQYSTSLTGNAANFYAQLLQSTAPDTLSQLAGEVASAGQNASFGAFNQLFGTIFGQIAVSRGARTATVAGASGQRASVEVADACSGAPCQPAAAGTSRLTYWAQGFGGSGSVDGNATTGSARVEVTSGGGAMGIDGRIAPGTILGLTLGTTSAGYMLPSVASTGTSQAIVMGVYASASAGPAYLDAALAYGFGSFTTQRYVSTGSLSEQVSGAFNGSQYGGRVEAGWRVAVDDDTVITPFASFTAQALQQNAYAETARNTATGAPGLTGLGVQAQTTLSLRSVLGVDVTTAFRADDDAVFRPRLRLGWAHEFDTYRASTATFLALGPGVPFTVQGAQPAPDALVATAAIEVELGGMLRLYGQFDGDFSGVSRAFAGTGGVRLVW